MALLKHATGSSLWSNRAEVSERMREVFQPACSMAACTTDLKQVVDGLAQEVENLTTVGSPATQATSPASKGKIATWRESKLNQLFS